MINLRKDVEPLFQKALQGEMALSAANDKEDGSFLSYFDEENGYERIYYLEDTACTLGKRILMDVKVESFLPKEPFARFLIKNIDPNALMVMEKLVLLWDNEEGHSAIRDDLEKEYGDEYAQYIADGDTLGQTWVDRQIPVINVSSIYRACKEIHEERADGPFLNFFAEGILQTIFHEFRHLFYECNEIVPIGSGIIYPQDGGKEEFVEEYGNSKAHGDLHGFLQIIAGKGLRDLNSINNQ